MNHSLRTLLAVTLCASGALTTVLLAQTRPTTTTTTSKPKPASAPVSPLTTQAAANYDKLIDSYMNARWEDITAQLKILSSGGAQTMALNLEQRKNVEWIRKAAPEQRPAWWEKTKSPSNITFQSTIWGKPLTTNYVPQNEELGVQVPVDIQDGKLVTIVMWRPTDVDNPRKAGGTLSKRLNIKTGDIGEVVVWHELGHNFISSAITADQALDLYRNHQLLYSTLQEFFADLTALAHCSAKSRPTVLLLRIDLLDPAMKYDVREPHTRGSHAIASALLFEILTDPTKWPNIHLPPTVPEENVELATITYILENWSTKWSFDEDRQLRDWAQKIVKTSGDQIFRKKGEVPLKDNLTFQLMEAQDRPMQAKRDAWIAEKLKKAIAAKQTDPLPTTQPKKTLLPPTPFSRIEVPIY